MNEDNVATTVHAETAPPRAHKRPRARRPLLLAGPLLVAVLGGWYWLQSGRYVSTDNAYIKTNKVAVSPQVSGVISAVSVAENQPVAAGELLFTIDPEPFRIARLRAEAEAAEVAMEIRALQASYRQKLAELELAQGDLAFAQRELDRQAQLARRDLVAEGNLDATAHERDSAAQRVSGLREDLARILASLGGDADSPVEAHPRYRTAQAELERATLDLQRTGVVAPFAGIASRVPQLGQYVAPGFTALSIVDDHHFWIEANFKETQLANLRPGLPARVEIDTYPGVEWRARVDSIGQASGAEFALLPPQNATGNWVKVVQRIPVRISIEPQDGQPALRTGMSTEVTVDTGRRHGAALARMLDGGIASVGSH